MNSLTALIVDDEPKACSVLHTLLMEYCPEIGDIKITTKPADAAGIINNEAPDVLFLDINMPKKNGFDLLDELQGFEGKIVFTTAYHEYAIKAFKYSAFDYLLKPIKIEDLIQTVSRIREVNLKSSNAGELRKLFEQFAQKQLLNASIAIHDKGGMLFINPSEIIYLEGQGNYTKIQCLDKHFIATKSIKSFEDSLDPDLFLRIHKSYIVNINHVVRYSPGNGGELEMANNHTVSVSRRKRHLLERFTI